MSWQAPNISHVLEHRLRTARLELMEDRRIQNANRARSTESINFLVQLIEEKIAAAARIGMDAVEASLRHAAGNALINAGVPIDTMRRTLEEAGAPFLQVNKMVSARVKHVGPSPLPVAAGLFAIWALAVLAAWATLDFPAFWCALGIGAGGVPAVGLFAWREGQLATLKKEMVGELPSRAVHHYMSQLDGCIDAYEHTVNAILRDESRNGYAATPRTLAQASAGPMRR
jgi:hypothetical protein